MLLSIEPEIAATEALGPLKIGNLIPLTTASPHKDCRVCIIAPVRNEASRLSATIRSFSKQVDDEGQAIDPNSYEVLILANNCSDESAAVGRSLSQSYLNLNLHVIEVSLPEAIAHVGTARRLVMNEAYRRLSIIGLAGRIIASTDGDTEVSPTWVNSLIREFDRGVDAVGGRILTRREADSGLAPEASLYFLRLLAHQYIAAQIETFLDPQPHDCWPRHFQYYGANMALLAELYGKVGGLPPMRQEEDVALYRRLQQVDAKIRHSPEVQVFTSARQVGRATGGLAELLERLTKRSRQKQAVLVESPILTEARILVREQLRQFWMDVNGDRTAGFRVCEYARRADLLGRSLGISAELLRNEIESAPTFGKLIEAIENHQKQQIDFSTSAWMNTEVSLANMHLRQLLQTLRHQADVHQSTDSSNMRYLRCVLQALKQVEAIPIFALRV